MLDQLRALITPAAKKLPKGVDVASFQGPPATWTKNAGNISWAAVKFTELEPNGNRYVNPDAAADWKWLHQHGKGRIAYLFGHPSVSAANTVSLFADEISKLGLNARDGIALDLEVSDGKTPAQVAAWAVKVAEGLFHSFHRHPLVYTFLNFAESGNCAGLGHYPLWIADPSSKMGHPRVPKPWSKWAIHQYSISGSIDRDVGNFASEKAMFAALGKPEGLEMRQLGGSIAGALSSVRWPNGITLCAGLGTNGFVQVARWEDGKWGAWKNVSPAKAKGAPGLLAWGSSQGRLYYTEESGAVVGLLTDDNGKTWT
ncbi:MAG TPA: GH25 family lysozyme [Streptosporangiaceae bacterium]